MRDSFVDTLFRMACLDKDIVLLTADLGFGIFEKFEKPFLCAFADNDPVTQGGEKQFLDRVPGTKGLPHTSIKGGGHFVQENAAEQLSREIVQLIQTTS